ncbi:MAG: LamG domain-containing protein [Methanoregulaceae archaeon]
MQQSGFMFRAFVIVLSTLLTGVPASADISGMSSTIVPSGYYSFNEMTGEKVFDSSGDSHFGLAYSNFSRIPNGNCGNALLFNGRDSYVVLPSTTDNHPKNQVTVELRFLINNLTDAPMVSTLRDGGYRLGFGDGNDLWWTVNVGGTDVSVPLRHEEISLDTWHLVAGTYDGQQLKIFLDGKMLASKKAAGSIRYAYNNPVIAGAEAGTDTAGSPAPGSPYFAGALDELRIYPLALTNGMVIDDMVNTCTPATGSVHLNLTPAGTPVGTQEHSPESITLAPGENRTSMFRIDSASSVPAWNITVPAGTLLSVSMADLPATYTDTWEIAIGSNGSTVAETTWTSAGSPSAFAVIPTGNAEVTARYRNGENRFPAHLSVQFESLPAPPLPPETATPQGPAPDTGLISWALAGVGTVAVFIGIVWILLKRKERKLRVFRK